MTAALLMRTQPGVCPVCRGQDLPFGCIACTQPADPYTTVQWARGLFAGVTR